jgi:hypothetical protein
MLKKISAIAISLSLLLCLSMNLNGQQQVLLSKHSYSAGSPGAWFSNSDEYYTYTEANNELFLSAISRHDVSGNNVYGDNSYIYNYHVTHSTLVNDLGKTYYYNIYNDSTNALYYSKTYSIDPQNRFTFYGQGTTFMQRYYNSVTGFLDSLMFRDWSSYSKFINTPDNINRVQSHHKYISSDSVNWQLETIRTFQYGNLLPLTLNLQTPELNNSNLCTVLDSNYELLTMTDYYPNSDYTLNWNFTYTLNSSRLVIMLRDEYYVNTYNYAFDLSGKITSTSYSSSIDYGTSYTWGEFVSSQDDFITPAVLHSYPNPFCNNLTINTKGISYENISIYNIKGQLVRSWQDVKSTELIWDGKNESNQPVSSGVFLIKARKGNQVINTKVLKY